MDSPSFCAKSFEAKIGRTHYELGVGVTEDNTMKEKETDLLNTSIVADGALNFVCIMMPLFVAGISERSNTNYFAWGWRVITFCRWVDTLWMLRTGGKIP